MFFAVVGSTVLFEWPWVHPDRISNGLVGGNPNGFQLQFMLTSTKNLAFSLHSRSAAKSSPEFPLFMGLAQSIITNVFSIETDPEELNKCRWVLCRSFVDKPLLTARYWEYFLGPLVSSLMLLHLILKIFSSSSVTQPNKYLKNSACHLRESSNSWQEIHAESEYLCFSRVWRPLCLRTIDNHIWTWHKTPCDLHIDVML